MSGDVSAADLAPGPRIGGDVVLEALVALGAHCVVGLPGQHALGLFEALRRSPLAYLGARVENNAGFMADGLARTSGDVAPLLLSTGPGALTSLAALQEAAAASVPVLAISSQVPSRGLGGGRHGYLHELPDQAGVFRGVVKRTWTVRSVSQITGALAQAWATARAAPAGPVLVEVPQDILLERVDGRLSPVDRIEVAVASPPVVPATLEAAARALAGSRRPAILAGGGVVRSGGTHELARLAEMLAAPVVVTPGGAGAIPLAHPNAAGGWIEDIATTELLEDADVLLVVGSGLGELSSNYHTFAPSGRVIQIEADLGKLGANHRVIGVHADAAEAMGALAEQLAARVDPVASAARREQLAPRLDALAATIERRLARQELGAERDLLRDVRDAVPGDADVFWDMTILGYWAWSAWDPRSGSSVSAQGAGGLGFAFPAAIGAAFGHRVDGGRTPVLAVSGDGGAMYGIAELATIAQERLDVVWLIVDDGGYGILREYMNGAFGAATATEISGPDFVALASSFGVAAERTDAAGAGKALRRAFAAGGPRVVVVDAVLRMFEPTHLGRRSAADRPS